MDETCYTPLSVKSWLGTLIISMIPLVGLIMLLVWAFGSDVHPSKANWAKALLLLTVILLALSFVLIFTIGLSLPVEMQQPAGM
ncbi:MAG: hypothetical protein JXQ68_06620 [Campylobacterales bacterium]|nr:hypothetical protein [Campylobacterales bacterium]